jgi:LmbE family N-acetylglucosaminyl deacetylase
MISILIADESIDRESLMRGVKDRILILAPHPDDFDAIGVTMKTVAGAGAEMYLTVVTSGASGVEDGFAGATSNAEKGAAREREQVASTDFFGLSRERVRFLRLTEDASGHPEMSPVNLQCIVTALGAVVPRHIFVPHPNDPNHGHQRTYAMLKLAIAELGWQGVIWLNRDPKTVDCRRDVVVRFGEEEAAWKSTLLLHHVSQEERNRRTRGIGFDERILGMNRRAAEDSGAPGWYEESFEIEVIR